MAAVLAQPPRVRRPVTAEVDLSRFAGLCRQEEDLKRKQADPTLYAHVLPVRFPPKEAAMKYPQRKTADNPLYRTSSASYGEAPPGDHQIHETWFPIGHHFTNEFTDSAPRDTGLVTVPFRSRVHKALDPTF